MKNKNVKVIDEHGIDRKASVVFSVDVDGSDYVVYWIERDTDNDNIFVSKLIKNIDGTSNMMNIEDSMEKGKISDIVKELIKYSIDNESNKLTNKTVTLPSGKVVNMTSVLINKEQNINVQKTYITTVKKAVTKVSEEYFDYEEEPVVNNEPQIFPVVEPTPEEKPIEPSIFPNEPSVLNNDNLINPEPITPVDPVEPEAPVVPDILPTEPINFVNPSLDINSSILTNTQSEPISAVPTEPVIPTPPVTPVIPSVVEPQIQPIIEPSSNVSSTVSESPIKESFINFSTPVASTPEPVVNNDNKLIFDASKESNLNEALSEVSSSSSIPVSNVQPIRDFGVDEVKPTEPVQQVQMPNNDVAGNKSGFANNKFFMVIAIMFFVASCVFLGYEVFNYFQVTK